MNQERKPINIIDVFPVGKRFLFYRRDGVGMQLGRWSAKVTGLNLEEELLMLEISQDWNGADTRGGQFWVDNITVNFDRLMIPLGLTVKEAK